MSGSPRTAPRVRRRAWGLIAFLGLAGPLVLVAPDGLAGQRPVDDLVARCPDAGPVPAQGCQDAALTVQALTGGLGLLSVGGTDLPGGASTLGWKLQRSPRIALFSRFKGQALNVPTPSGPSGGAAGDETFNPWALEIGAGLGAFDGFSLAPTVGGVLSLDVLASAQWNLLPESPGFSSNAWSWTGGVRLGILRESFSLPAVSVSARYSRMSPGAYAFGDSTGVSADLEVTTRSFRAVVGKDLLAIGLLAGVGWDAYSADGSFGFGGVENLSVDGFEVGRTVFFGQANLTYLILQFSLEGGWANGLDPLATPYLGSHDPGSGTAFGALSVRITL